MVRQPRLLRQRENLLLDSLGALGRQGYHLRLAVVLYHWGLVQPLQLEQVKSLDYRSRSVKRIGAAPEAVLDEVLSILDACIY